MSLSAPAGAVPGAPCIFGIGCDPGEICLDGICQLDAPCDPGAVEVCDGLDNNCNGTIDEGGVCCGDGACAPGEELSCPDDCGFCGDGVCAPGEALFCPEDCGPPPPGCTSNAQCEDGNPCTIDLCDAATGQCFSDYDPSCIFCGDGVCTPGEELFCPEDCFGFCGDGVCAPGEELFCPEDCQPPPPGCTSDAQCEDGNPCTFDSCDPATGQCFSDYDPSCIFCGDGVCTPGEELFCPEDCFGFCGDGICAPGEELFCPEDCQPPPPGCTSDAQCEDGDPCTVDFCNAATGQCVSQADPACFGGDCCADNDTPGCDDPAVTDCVCAFDPFCCDVRWDGICVQEGAEQCGSGCAVATCGDGLCAPGEEFSCPQDCGIFCGDGLCGPGEETTCPEDCGIFCGDGLCAPGEELSCPSDCGIICGNGLCEPFEETTCPEDCGTVCGDGLCFPGEEIFCPEDCGFVPCTSDAQCEDGDPCTFNFCDAASGQCVSQADPACFGGDCCADKDSPGCDDPAVTDCVCALDPFCCDVRWDAICVDEATNQCGAVCAPPACGDGICQPGEEPFCPEDCGPPTGCLDTCSAEQGLLMDECLAQVGDPGFCDAITGFVFEACVYECAPYPIDTCEENCGLQARFELRGCLLFGPGDFFFCADQAQQINDACLQGCGPTGCLDQCAQGANEVRNACLAQPGGYFECAGACDQALFQGEDACNQALDEALATCLPFIDPACQDEAFMAYDQCLQDVWLGYDACVQPCLPLADGCEGEAQAFYQACVQDCPCQDQCPAQAQAAYDACAQAPGGPFECQVACDEAAQVGFFGCEQQLQEALSTCNPFFDPTCEDEAFMAFDQCMFAVDMAAQACFQGCQGAFEVCDQLFQDAFAECVIACGGGCGDGICDANEGPDTCPADCGGPPDPCQDACGVERDQLFQQCVAQVGDDAYCDQVTFFVYELCLYECAPGPLDCPSTCGLEARVVLRDCFYAEQDFVGCLQVAVDAQDACLPTCGQEGCEVLCQLAADQQRQECYFAPGGPVECQGSCEATRNDAGFACEVALTEALDACFLGPFPIPGCEDAAFQAFDQCQVDADLAFFDCIDACQPGFFACDQAANADLQVCLEGCAGGPPDQCPDDPDKTEPGLCGCGVPDVDSDGDGALDCDDLCPADAGKVEPGVCGCDTADTDTDGDGVADCQDGCPEDAGKVEPGICGCGTADIDTDCDGVADCVDGCPEDAGKVAPGICGCGTADTDTDGDGVPDCVDGCPEDAGKTQPGVCGCGVADTDSDTDGVADCVDNCPTVANGGQEDTDLDGFGDACDPCPLDDENDADGDGVCGDVDLCPDTACPEVQVPEKELGTNRWVLSDACDGTFMTTHPKGKGPQKSFSLADTFGCSCEQILAAHLAAGDEMKGHWKLGCSQSVMQDWIVDNGGTLPFDDDDDDDGDDDSKKDKKDKKDK